MYPQIVDLPHVIHHSPIPPHLKCAWNIIHFVIRKSAIILSLTSKLNSSLACTCPNFMYEIYTLSRTNESTYYLYGILIGQGRILTTQAVYVLTYLNIRLILSLSCTLAFHYTTYTRLVTTLLSLLYTSVLKCTLFPHTDV